MSEIRLKVSQRRLSPSTRVWNHRCDQAAGSSGGSSLALSPPGRHASFANAAIHCVATGASPKPRLFTAPATPDSLWLVCEVDGAFPEPKVEFLDGAGARNLPEKNQLLVKDGRHHIKASIRVTQTDNFTCGANPPPDVCVPLRPHLQSVFISTSSTVAAGPPGPPGPHLSACFVFQEVTRPPWTPNGGLFSSFHLF